MVEWFKEIIEKYSFGVCTYLAEKLGISRSLVRIYFIYLSFAAPGSTILLYLITAFWLSVKRNFRKGRNVLFN